MISPQNDAGANILPKWMAMLNENYPGN